MPLQVTPDSETFSTHITYEWFLSCRKKKFVLQFKTCHKNRIFAIFYYLYESFDEPANTNSLGILCHKIRIYNSFRRYEYDDVSPRNNDGQNLFHKIHTDGSFLLYASIECDTLNRPIAGKVYYKTHNCTAYLPSANACEPKGNQKSTELLMNLSFLVDWYFIYEKNDL